MNHGFDAFFPLNLVPWTCKKKRSSDIPYTHPTVCTYVSIGAATVAQTTPPPPPPLSSLVAGSVAMVSVCHGNAVCESRPSPLSSRLCDRFVRLADEAHTPRARIVTSMSGMANNVTSVLPPRIRGECKMTPSVMLMLRN